MRLSDEELEALYELEGEVLEAVLTRDWDHLRDEARNK